MGGTKKKAGLWGIHKFMSICPGERWTPTPMSIAPPGLDSRVGFFENRRLRKTNFLSCCSFVCSQPDENSGRFRVVFRVVYIGFYPWRENFDVRTGLCFLFFEGGFFVLIPTKKAMDSSKPGQGSGGALGLVVFANFGCGGGKPGYKSGCCCPAR